MLRTCRRPLPRDLSRSPQRGQEPSPLQRFVSRSSQHPLQFLHALMNLRLQPSEALQNLARRAVRDFFVNDFLVAVEREVVALRGNVGLGHAETLRSARAGKFIAPRSAKPRSAEACLRLLRRDLSRRV